MSREERFLGRHIILPFPALWRLLLVRKLTDIGAVMFCRVLSLQSPTYIFPWIIITDTVLSVIDSLKIMHRTDPLAQCLMRNRGLLHIVFSPLPISPVIPKQVFSAPYPLFYKRPTVSHAVNHKNTEPNSKPVTPSPRED